MRRSLRCGMTKRLILLLPALAMLLAGVSGCSESDSDSIPASSSDPRDTVEEEKLEVLDLRGPYGKLKIEVPEGWVFGEDTSGSAGPPNRLVYVYPDREVDLYSALEDESKVPPIITVFLTPKRGGDTEHGDVPYFLGAVGLSPPEDKVIEDPIQGVLESGLAYERFVAKGPAAVVNGPMEDNGVFFCYRLLGLPYHCTVTAFCNRWARETEEEGLMRCVESLVLLPAEAQ